MINNRVIVNLLIKNGKLVKTRRFGKSQYVGDPINAIKIFNEKAVDELVITDMTATENGIDFDLVHKMATEAFIPICYSGGIKTEEDAHNLFKLGIEKVCLTSAAVSNKFLLKQLVETYGSQSVVVNINAKKNIFGKLKVFDAERKKNTSLSLIEHVNSVVDINIGELILTDVDRDGELCGLNLELLQYAKSVSMPVVIAGGMKSAHELVDASMHGASAVMGGSCFVFHGPHRAVLISYPFGGGYKIMKDVRKND
ncbi:HisA/HisF-related TIM barrel protein [Shewanella sedimentimangrovi]|uniref:Imidazole glycerol phosphate synthase subunit HisF n=1 Tax=Shewanella sedimentimangrovi TaxID=2814293 RepID=A0ABX7QWZ6_9GAMM|nr:HisA/HisF-related TIM barrel protein [Shewanella sedimentimangrovi]QSX36032.1 imidazole glycerol phosphate synthase subunit HisF [Shewanella sedimentimangrovi]